MSRSSPPPVSQSPAASARWAGKAPDRDGQQTVKKLAILGAAAALFRKHGYERTSLNDIAQVLNVTKPTLYYYIKSKEDILVEIQQTGFDEIMEELTELGRGPQSGAEMLRRVIVRYANWVTSEFGVCVVRHFLITLAPRHLARVRRGRRAGERRIRETIERGIQDGSLRRCDPWVVSTAVIGAMNWMAFWYEAGPSRRTAAEMADAYCDLLIEGIGARPEVVATTGSMDGSPPATGGETGPKAKAKKRRLPTRKGTAARNSADAKRRATKANT